jgi:hypothetical protein
MCDDDVTIGVTEVVNNIQVTAQPNDQIIDIDVIDNSDEVTLNVTPCLVEVNINKGSSFARWGTIYGNILDQVDLQNALFNKADLINGKVPANQLPSFVDDVIEVANFAALPTVGETGKIYITLDNNKIYRWSGSVYIEIASNNAVWGAITGTLSNQTDLQNSLDAKQPLDGDLTSIAGLTGTSGLLRKTAANTYSLDTNTYALDNTVVKLTGNQSITGIKTFTTVAGSALIVTNNTSDWGQFINNNSTGQGLEINNASTGVGLVLKSSGTSTGDVISHQGIDGLIKFKLTSVGNVTANSFIKSGGTDAQILAANGSVLTAGTNITISGGTISASGGGSVGSLEFNATDLTVWNNGKGNVASNASFGDNALKSNTTGAVNSAYGTGALMTNTTGSTNSAFGNYALGENTVGNNNTGLGYYALPFNISGSSNIAIGNNSANLISNGSSLTNTNNSIFIGADTRPNSNNQTNQIVIGHNAVGHGSNTVTLGNSSIVTTILRGNVGIGTTSPQTITGTARVLEVNGSSYGFILASSGSVVAQVAGDNASGFVNIGARSNHPLVFTQNDTERMRVTPSGNINIITLGTGTVYSNAGTLTNTNPSDERLKENIEDLEYGLTEILQLRPVSYNWINDTANQGKQFGFIAQEVQEIMPELINEFTITEDEEEVVRLGLDKEAIFVAMVNAIKELKAEIDLLKQKA